MKWIKVDIPEFKEQSYVDTDKAFRFHIKPIKVKSEIMYRVRAFFLVNQNANEKKTAYLADINYWYGKAIIYFLWDNGR